MRRRHFFLLCATIATGLGVRAHGFPAPAWFTKPAGDALYATAVSWMFSLLFPRWRLGHTAAASMLFCTAIEFLKFCGLPWLIAARHSPVGRLVFGVGFHTENLLWYSAGTLLAVAVELALQSLCGQPTSRRV